MPITHHDLYTTPYIEYAAEPEGSNLNRARDRDAATVT